VALLPGGYATADGAMPDSPRAARARGALAAALAECVGALPNGALFVLHPPAREPALRGAGGVRRATDAWSDESEEEGGAGDGVGLGGPPLDEVALEAREAEHSQLLAGGRPRPSRANPRQLPDPA
jgi:hypothetical protein